MYRSLDASKNNIDFIQFIDRHKLFVLKANRYTAWFYYYYNIEEAESNYLLIKYPNLVLVWDNMDIPLREFL